MIESDGLEGMQMGVIMVWWNAFGKPVKIVTPQAEI